MHDHDHGHHHADHIADNEPDHERFNNRNVDAKHLCHYNHHKHWDHHSDIISHHIRHVDTFHNADVDSNVHANDLSHVYRNQLCDYFTDFHVDKHHHHHCINKWDYDSNHVCYDERCIWWS